MVQWTFKVSNTLDPKSLTNRVRDTKDEEILGGFSDYELKKLKIIVKSIRLKRYLRVGHTQGQKTVACLLSNM